MEVCEKSKAGLTFEGNIEGVKAWGGEWLIKTVSSMYLYRLYQ